ncbi:MAG: lipocalin-like domain-containing protein [Alphaproteobacteria bacterium]
MNRLGAFAVALLCLGVVLPGGDAMAQSLKKQVVGTWTVVSSINTRPDGSTFQPFGLNPNGRMILAANGRFSIQIHRPDLPKYAGNNRMEGSAEENKATVQGVISYFGTYTVSAADHTLNFHIESSSYPNWNGTDQKRLVTVKGDEMKYTNPTASTGAKAELVWKRAK